MRVGKAIRSALVVPLRVAGYVFFAAGALIILYALLSIGQAISEFEAAQSFGMFVGDPSPRIVDNMLYMAGGVVVCVFGYLTAMKASLIKRIGL